MVIGMAIVVMACSGDDRGPAASTTTAEGDSSPTSSTLGSLGAADDLAGVELDGVVLARALVQGTDLVGFEERSGARPYQADERPGLLICGEVLRAETGLVDGVQSVLVNDSVQVTVTVTAAADSEEAARFVDRFAEIAAGCAQPWTQNVPLLGVGTLEAEVIGEADVGVPGPQVRAYRLRTRTEIGSSEVIAVAMAVGPVLTTVTVVGPTEDDLAAAPAAVAAAVRRSTELVRALD